MYICMSGYSVREVDIVFPPLSTDYSELEREREREFRYEGIKGVSPPIKAAKEHLVGS